MFGSFPGSLGQDHPKITGSKEPTPLWNQLYLRNLLCFDRHSGFPRIPKMEVPDIKQHSGFVREN